MGPVPTVISQRFSTILRGGAIAPGSICSHCLFPITTSPDPDLTLTPYPHGKSTPSGLTSRSRRLQVPLQPIIVSSIMGLWRCIARFEAGELGFGNKTWTAWVERTVVSKVRGDMGLDAKEGPGGEIIIELKELLLVGAGGQVVVKPRAPAKKTGIGNMMITLPSKFTGCDLSISHPQHGTNILNISIASDDSFQVIAWYTDTLVGATPVNGGNFCALLYTIYHKEAGQLSIPGQIPSALTLGTTGFFQSRLIQTLRRWSQQINLAIANLRGSPRRLGIPLKMVFPYKTKTHTYDIVNLLAPAASRANFGIVHATLRYQRIRYAVPVVSPGEPYEGWEFEGEGQFQKGAKALLEASEVRRPSGASTDNVFVERLQVGLAEHGWAVDMVTEVVKMLGDAGEKNVEATWGKEDLGQGNRQVVLTFLVPVIILFPLAHIDLVLADMGC